MPDTEYLTTAEAAELLGVSRRTVHRLATKGAVQPDRLPFAGRHGAYLFRREDVEQLRSTVHGDTAA